MAVTLFRKRKVINNIVIKNNTKKEEKKEEEPKKAIHNEVNAKIKGAMYGRRTINR